MKATEYFEKQVLFKRPYIKLEWCEKALIAPIKKEIQQDGRIRQWIFIEEYQKFLRVVTLEDGNTIHNAFFDRNFNK